MTPAAELKSEEDIGKLKLFFVECLQKFCNGKFVIDDNNREIISDIFYWCLRVMQPEAKLDPSKGLWIYGKIGTGKSVIMRGVIEFINACWLIDSGERVNFKWRNVCRFCDDYASNGYDALEHLPMGFDELGTEYSPTNHLGNKLNVMSQVLSDLNDTPWGIPTIVTTNLLLEQVVERYTERAADRIGKLFNIIYMGGKTRRDSNAFWQALQAEQSQNY